MLRLRVELDGARSVEFRPSVRVYGDTRKSFNEALLKHTKNGRLEDILEISIEGEATSFYFTVKSILYFRVQEL